MKHKVQASGEVEMKNNWLSITCYINRWDGGRGQKYYCCHYGLGKDISKKENKVILLKEIESKVLWKF